MPLAEKVTRDGGGPYSRQVAEAFGLHRMFGLKEYLGAKCKLTTEFLLHKARGISGAR